MKPRFVRSFKDFLSLISKYEIGVGIRGPVLRSTHYFEMRKGKVVDLSMVDGSTTEYTLRELKKSFYAEAIEKGAMILEDKSILTKPKRAKRVTIES